MKWKTIISSVCKIFIMIDMLTKQIDTNILKPGKFKTSTFLESMPLCRLEILYNDAEEFYSGEVEIMDERIENFVVLAAALKAYEDDDTYIEYSNEELMLLCLSLFVIVSWVILSKKGTAKILNPLSIDPYTKMKVDNDEDGKFFISTVN